jgi:hypothetical protein
MKLDISFLAGIFLIGSDLLARAAVQGVDQALFAAAVEYGSRVAMRASTLARAGVRLCFTKNGQ